MKMTKELYDRLQRERSRCDYFEYVICDSFPVSNHNHGDITNCNYNHVPSVLKCFHLITDIRCLQCDQHSSRSVLK